MSLFSLRRNAPQSPSNDPAAAPGAGAPATAPAVHPLDGVTGGAFSAATSGERAAKVRAWLQSEPGWESMNEVFKELSQRDRGAAKPLKEKLDELRRQKAQEHIGIEWAQKARTLIEQPRLNLADAMAWQRDAARAGAPLSREPLAGLKAALADRVKAIEDLQHRVQVERESAVLMAQRIEILSTKSWKDAQLALDGLRADVLQWQQLVAGLSDDPQWPSVEPRFPPMLEASRHQLQLVWDAFEAALAQAVAADADAQAPLPAVPVWAEELRQARGLEKTAEADSTTDVQQTERRAKAQADMARALSILEREVAQGHGKATPKAANDVRSLLRAAGRLLGADLEARAHAVLVQAGELEDWQRWRADQLREELVGKAEALLAAPEGQRLGGRKMQETLRSLREQWKTTDQGGQANHALWKRFDEACTRAHKEVEVWLAQVRQQAQAHQAQRLALIEEVKAWTAEHAGKGDWKHQIRDLHAFSERWREAGHLSEKAFAELQPLWKDAMRAAHVELEAAQAQSLAQRRAMIDEAVALGQAPQLHIDAVKALQQRWQAEAHAVPLDRKQEQKLWEAFRQPIDEAFQRKSTERVKAAAALSAHDQRVFDAARALEAASATGDAQQIRAAQQALEQAIQGEPASNRAPETPNDPPRQPTEQTPSTESAPGADAPTVPPAPARKLVAMRGDDRPGMKKAEPAGRDERRAPGHRDSRGPRDAGRGGREHRAVAAPRLGDAAFRAQRQALEHAELALRKLAAQAHGEVLTQLLAAWERRDPAQMPSAQALGRAASSTRSAWAQALGGAPVDGAWAEALLRLEMAAEVPSPAEQIEARRQLQLQLLTRRHEAAPAETWPQDVGRVLAAAFESGAARRLQQVLKVLLRR
jgi:hypothetical protein